MDSDSDVDMSWVELVAGGDQSLKRAISQSSMEVEPDAKRSKTVCEGIPVGVQTKCETENMLDGLREAVVDEGSLQVDGDESEGSKLVEGGTEEGGHVEEETRKDQEKIRTERQKERDEKTAFWTTPGLRPLAEPPILDWDWFDRVKIPSDLRFKALFPDDPEKRCTVKDLHGERTVLSEYSYCTGMARDDPETDSRRWEFYRNLLDDIAEDYEEVAREYYDIWDMATELSRFEFQNLDNDGRTTRLEQWVNKGADVFYKLGDKVREEYSYLVPQDFVENRLATFEFYFVYLNGGTDWISNEMLKRHDVLVGWPQEVQDKYGHLRRYFPRPPPFASGTPTSIHSEALPKYDDLSSQLKDLLPTKERRHSI